MKCHWLLLYVVVTLVMGNDVVPQCQYDSCSKCIQGPTCMWCEVEANITQNSERCISEEAPESDDWRKRCGTNNIINYLYSITTFNNSDFSDGTGGQPIIQIKPQGVEMKLRVKQPRNFTIEYKHAKNYPADFYYLMDVSQSMSDDLVVLHSLVKKLTESIENITSDFTLGFGVFIDKVLLPYVSTVPADDLSMDKCEGLPFSFRHYLALTDNAAEFEQMVLQAKVACNVDGPEGGLDALMQVMVCDKQIKWRTQSQRLIILATDNAFHFAGDGKLGGIVTPNDMQCHLNSSGFYTYSSITDYPSISQIRDIAKQTNVNMIFACTENQKPLYDRLTRKIEGSSVGVLNQDSSNIVDLITEKFREISSSVIFRDNAKPPLKVRYFSKCMGTNMTERSSCTNLKPNDLVKFKVEVTIEECPEIKDLQNQVFNITVEGRSNYVQVNVSMHCICKCEQPGDKGYITNAKQCNEQGDFKCGICACKEGYLGRHCECKESGVGIDVTTEDSCKMDNSSNVCSGRGNCLCGVCQCHTREPPQLITGEFCQCTNYLNCGSSERLCSGNGKCECNQCKCNAGWKGPYCDCQNGEENCINPSTRQICSLQGECECNECKCNSTHYGKHCEDCPDCQGMCSEYQSCVQCQAFNKGNLFPDECTSNCTMLNITKVSQLVANTDEGERLCSVYDDDDCRFVFVYNNNLDHTEVEIRVQEELECPKPVNAWGVVSGVLGIVVLIGVVTLIAWRILASIHDRREYAKFILAQQDAKWPENVNPLYKKATTTTQNPMFGASN